jgi:Spy/CpxP family protein refolding chaperone
MSGRFSKVLLSSILLLGPLAFAQSDDRDAPNLQFPVANLANNQMLTEIVFVQPTVPLGPKDILDSYETGMASVVAQLSDELGAIVAQVGANRLSREQAEYLARERSDVAAMQFQVLSAFHAILQHAVEQAPVTASEPQPPPRQRLIVPLPFSSLELSPVLAKYLNLTPTQISAIRQLMGEERPHMTPLIAALDGTRQKLELISQDSPLEQKQVHALARAQARLLTQLIEEDSKLQAKIRLVLNSEQIDKLDGLKQDMQLRSVSTGEN